jgi:hypothetical protein
MSKQKIVDAFNAKNPVGTPVRYWTGLKEGPGKESKTRSRAEILSGHTPVVWVENESGCICLTHVQVIRR